MKHVAVIVVVAACSHTPSGALGAHWGDPVGDVLARNHLTCIGGGSSPPFADCEVGKVEHLARHPRTTLVLEAGQLAGVSFHFEGDDCVKVQPAIGAAYHVDYTAGAKGSPYTVFGDDELVYFDDCTLVVAGPHYGKAFVDRLLRSGWSDVVRGFQVH